MGQGVDAITNVCRDLLGRGIRRGVQVSVFQKHRRCHRRNVNDGERAVGIFHNVKALAHCAFIANAITTAPGVGAVAGAVRQSVNRVVARRAAEPVVARTGHHGVFTCACAGGKHPGAQH